MYLPSISRLPSSAPSHCCSSSYIGSGPSGSEPVMKSAGSQRSLASRPTPTPRTPGPPRYPDPAGHLVARLPVRRTANKRPAAVATRLGANMEVQTWARPRTATASPGCSVLSTIAQSRGCAPGLLYLIAVQGVPGPERLKERDGIQESNLSRCVVAKEPCRLLWHRCTRSAASGPAQVGNHG
jgi:hypothetical protein